MTVYFVRKLSTVLDKAQSWPTVRPQTFSVGVRFLFMDNENGEDVVQGTLNSLKIAQHS